MARACCSAQGPGALPGVQTGGHCTAHLHRKPHEARPLRRRSRCSRLPPLLAPPPRWPRSFPVTCLTAPPPLQPRSPDQPTASRLSAPPRGSSFLTAAVGPSNRHHGGRQPDQPAGGARWRSGHRRALGQRAAAPRSRWAGPWQRGVTPASPLVAIRRLEDASRGQPICQRATARSRRPGQPSAPGSWQRVWQGPLGSGKWAGGAHGAAAGAIAARAARTAPATLARTLLLQRLGNRSQRLPHLHPLQPPHPAAAGWARS